MDTIKYLLEDEYDGLRPVEAFSFSSIAKLLIDRQRQDKDTIIVTSGDRGAGKSNWNLKLILAYIKMKKEIDASFTWKWKDNFPLTREQAIENAESIPDGSFICYDEGGDIMYSADTLNARNKRLVKFMAKSRSKNLFTSIALPDIFMLDKKILNMALFLVTVPYRYKNVCSFSFIYGRNPNPFIQDKFGIEHIKNLFRSKKAPLSARMPSLSGRTHVTRNGERVTVPYPRDLFKFLSSLPTFLHQHKFGPCPKKFEEMYIKNVKSRQLYANADNEYVKKLQYIKVKRMYENLVYNLFNTKNMTYAEIERQHRDQEGNLLSTTPTIKKMLEKLAVKYNKGEE